MARLQVELTEKAYYKDKCDDLKSQCVDLEQHVAGLQERLKRATAYQDRLQEQLMAESKMRSESINHALVQTNRLKEQTEILEEAQKQNKTMERLLEHWEGVCFQMRNELRHRSDSRDLSLDSSRGGQELRPPPQSDKRQWSPEHPHEMSRGEEQRAAPPREPRPWKFERQRSTDTFSPDAPSADHQMGMMDDDETFAML
ncbi:hypothetical protein T484DRAFT_1935071 [Baffinella frigidus]|nr:hypothetical protein T484DRAFT_1935071 [Cryptophyta sp. CCMP2293]